MRAHAYAHTHTHTHTPTHTHTHTHTHTALWGQDVATPEVFDASTLETYMESAGIEGVVLTFASGMMMKLKAKR